MSNGNIWLAVNKSEETFAVDYSCILNDRVTTSNSPIDHYYKHAKHIVTTALGEQVNGNQILLRLLVLEAVSNAEHYFRSVLSELVELCPVSRKHASRKSISLGSIEYYEKNKIGYALLENMSLSESGNIKKQTKSITDFEITNNTSLDIALREFEKICQLRHAIAHARGDLGSNNCIALGIGVKKPQCITLNNKTFQDLASKVNNAVRAYNAFLFDKTIKRWAKTTVLQGKWIKDKRMFTRVYLLFYSANDNTDEADPKSAYLKIKDKIAVT